MKAITARIKTKLNNTDGASILIALLLFLVAAMVSAVIISTAMSAFKTVHEDFDREQDYLSVSSGAKVLSKCLEDTTVTVKKETTTNSKTNTSTTETTYTHEGVLGAYMAKAIDLGVANERTLTVSFDTSQLSSDAKKALCNCEFIFKLTPMDPEDPDGPMTVKGTVTAPGCSQKIYISALCSVSGPPPTDIYPEDNHDLRITTEIKTYDWEHITLSINEKSEAGSND